MDTTVMDPWNKVSLMFLTQNPVDVRVYWCWWTISLAEHTPTCNQWTRYVSWSQHFNSKTGWQNQKGAFAWPVTYKFDFGIAELPPGKCVTNVYFLPGWCRHAALFTFLASKSAGYHQATDFNIDYFCEGLQIALQSEKGPASNECWSDTHSAPLQRRYDGLQTDSTLTWTRTHSLNTGSSFI